MADKPLSVVEGTVEAVAQNAPNRYGVKLYGKWYNGFGTCRVAKGDHVYIEYELTERDEAIFRNIKLIKKVDDETGQIIEEADKKTEINGKDDRMIRAWALKLAVLSLSEEVKQCGIDENIIKELMNRAKSFKTMLETEF